MKSYVEAWPIDSIYQPGKFGIPVLPNMKWILPMQMCINLKFPLTIHWVDAH